MHTDITYIMTSRDKFKQYNPAQILQFSHNRFMSTAEPQMLRHTPLDETGESAVTVSCVVAQNVTIVDKYWQGKQHRENHTCTGWANCGLRQSSFSFYKKRRDIAVALSESLISIAPRVFKDRRPGTRWGDVSQKTLWPVCAILKSCCWFGLLCFDTKNSAYVGRVTFTCVVGCVYYL